MGMTVDAASLLNKTQPTTTAVSASVKDSSLESKGASTAPLSRNDDMEKDDFLMLLVTQLRYQDPLSPMDNMQFAAQLAQFRQLESTNNMQSSIDKLGESFGDAVQAQTDSAAAMSNTSAVSMIGKVVRLEESSVRWEGIGSEAVQMRINLGSHASARVEIHNAKGEVVKTLRTEEKGADGTTVLAWDGTTDQGQSAPVGVYDIVIAGAEDSAQLYAFVEDVVQGVRFDEKGAMLKIAGKELPLANVMDVAMDEQSAQFGGLSRDSAMAMLDKDVTLFKAGVQSPVAGEEAVFTINMGSEKSAVVELVDETGAVVKQLEAVANEEGIATVRWDGTAKDGVTRVKQGGYEIHFANEDEKPYLYAFETGRVEGVSTSGGIPMVKVNGLYYPLSQVLEIASSRDGEA
jgi:flagellar basal-body rod modification protein FlgD